MPKSYINIDNPGHGDCGFYAVAIGLIQHLQRELQGNSGISWLEKLVHGSTPVLDRLIKLISTKYSRFLPLVQNRKNFEERILRFNLLECKSQKSDADSALLDEFNVLFRHMIMTSRVNEYPTIYLNKNIVGAYDTAKSVKERQDAIRDKFRLFREVRAEFEKRSANLSSLMDPQILFKHFCSSKQLSPFDTDIMKTYQKDFPDFLQKIQGFAEQWKNIKKAQENWLQGQLEKIPEDTPEEVKQQHKERLTDQTKVERKEAKLGFFYLHMTQANPGQSEPLTIVLEDNSPLKNFLQQQSEPGQRASLLDLSLLSELLGIQLETYSDGVKNESGELDTGNHTRPIVRVDMNDKGGHWTTLLDNDTIDANVVGRFPPEALIGVKEARKRTKVTKERIENLLSKCTSFCVCREDVVGLIEACRDSKKTVDDIMIQYIGYFKEIDSNLMANCRSEEGRDDFVIICDELCKDLYGKDLCMLSAERRLIRSSDYEGTSGSFTSGANESNGKEQIASLMLNYSDEDQNAAKLNSIVSKCLEPDGANATPLKDIILEVVRYLLGRESDGKAFLQKCENEDQSIMMWNDLCQQYCGKSLSEMVREEMDAGNKIADSHGQGEDDQCCIASSSNAPQP